MNNDLPVDAEVARRAAALNSVAPPDVWSRLLPTYVAEGRPHHRPPHPRRRRQARVVLAGGLAAAAAVAIATVAVLDDRGTRTERIGSVDSPAADAAADPAADASAEHAGEVTSSSAPPLGTEAAPMSVPSSAVPAAEAPPPGSVVSATPTDTSAAPVAPNWMPTALAPPPLSERDGMATAATPTHVLAWGGAPGGQLDGSGGYFTDGAVLDLATGRWAPTAPAPLPEELATAVAYHDGFVVAAVTGFAVARGITPDPAIVAYDPPSDTWTDITPPGEPPVDYLVVVGDEVIALPAALAWNGASWRALRAPPPWQYGVQLAATDDELFALDTTIRELPFRRGLVWRYDVATDTWSEFGLTSFEVYDGSALAIAGHHLVVASWSEMKVGWFDMTTGAWTDGGRMPVDDTKCSMSAAGVADDVVVVDTCVGFVVVTFDGRPAEALVSPGRTVSGVWNAFSTFQRSGDRLVLGVSHTVGDEFWSQRDAWGPFPLFVLGVERDAIASWSAAGTPLAVDIDIGNEVTVELTMGCSLSFNRASKPVDGSLTKSLPTSDGTTEIFFEVPPGVAYRLACGDAKPATYAAAAEMLAGRDRSRTWPEPPLAPPPSTPGPT